VSGDDSFLWCGRAVAFRAGETVAAALRRAGVRDLGPAGGPVRGRVFCGIGACQACLVAEDGGPAFEACLTPARAGLVLVPATVAGDGSHG
jgi:hypothetical protein